MYETKEMYVKPRSASESSSVTMQISFITQSGSSANLRAHPTSPPFCSSPALSEGPIFAFFCIPFCGFNMARPGRESRDYSTPGRSLHGQRDGGSEWLQHDSHQNLSAAKTGRRDEHFSKLKATTSPRLTRQVVHNRTTTRQFARHANPIHLLHHFRNLIRYSGYACESW